MPNDIAPVGYKTPPQHTRFKKGQSGNPKGRPKGSGKTNKNMLQYLSDILNEKVTINDKHGPKDITIRQALIYAQIKKAMNGDIRAFSQILNMLPIETSPPTLERIIIETKDARIISPC